MCVFALATYLSPLGAMKQEWPPSPERVWQEMSKPYVKAGIQEMQQEVAREMWERPGSDRKKLVDNYVHSIGFQAVIGQMQENFGLTDGMIIEQIKKMKVGLSEIDETTKDTWMPIINFVYPRLSQLMLAKTRIYTDNDLDTLVGIISIAYEAYVKAIAKSKNIALEEPTNIVSQQYQLLEKIDNRIKKIRDAVGLVLCMHKIDEKLTGYISKKLFAFNQVLKEYPIINKFQVVFNCYVNLIKDLSSNPLMSEKMPTSLRNKLKKAVIAARDRHKAI